MTDSVPEADVDPISEGFRQPPKQVSLSCFMYMGRIMELRSFISVFFGALKSSDKTKEIIESLDRHEFRYKMSGYNLVKYDYSQHRQLMNEIMLSRAVETFNIYLIGILREVFVKKPEMLKSESQIDTNTLIELRDFNSIVAHIAEKKLNELSYKPLSDLRDYIFKRTGLELFKSNAVFNGVLLSSEIRNLIAHNDCRSNDVFKRRTKDVDISDISIRAKDSKIILKDEWIRKISYLLDSVVFDFDEAATSKFSIDGLHKISS